MNLFNNLRRLWTSPEKELELLLQEYPKILWSEESPSGPSLRDFQNQERLNWTRARILQLQGEVSPRIWDTRILKFLSSDILA